MQLYPTRSTVHVAVAGIGLVTLGAAARLPPVVAFGGAVILVVAFGRAVARATISRLRAAGFEMVWKEPGRVHRLARGQTVVVRGELRNRGDLSIRVTAVRAIASSFLDVAAEPDVLAIGPGASAEIALTVRATRVGRWGLHGIAIAVSAAPLGARGLFEAALLFANPLGIEVLPAGLGVFSLKARGGRARRAGSGGPGGRAAGEGDELRELRDHAPGDPFKRIAWKASAKRGRLLVRETEREERDVVWLVVDSSIDLWAGAPGGAPLDVVVEDVAKVAERHLRAGDQVGLVVTASRMRSWIEPKANPSQGAIIAGALASAAAAVDADRSELDEAGVARRVAEHARPLDPKGLSDLPKDDLDALAARAEQLRLHAPFAPRLPFATTPREQRLRHYLASFGIECPPRSEGEHGRAEAAIAIVLGRLRAERPRPSIVHVWAPPPASPAAMAGPLSALRRRGAEIRWTLPPLDAGLSAAPPGSRVAAAADEAVRVRARVANQRGTRELRRLGVRLVRGQASRMPSRAIVAPAPGAA